MPETKQSVTAIFAAASPEERVTILEALRQQNTVSRQEAALLMGWSYADVKAATNRIVDPLPSVVAGKGTGSKITRKVIVAEIDPWLAREAARQSARR